MNVRVKNNDASTAIATPLFGCPEQLTANAAAPEGGLNDDRVDHQTPPGQLAHELAAAPAIGSASAASTTYYLAADICYSCELVLTGRPRQTFLEPVGQTICIRELVAFWINIVAKALAITGLARTDHRLT